MIRRISNKRSENRNRNSVRRNIRNRRFESVEDSGMRSIDDFYGLDFMDGNNSGYYSPKGTPHDSYASVECFIDDVDGFGKFGVFFEDIEVDGIVDFFFDTMNLERDPLRRKRPSEFTDEDIQGFVENCINSGDFSHTESEPKYLWSEQNAHIRGFVWAYDDMIAELDRCAREQEQKLLDAEWDACRMIKNELSMATEARNIRNPRVSGRRNEENEYELKGKTGALLIKPLSIHTEDDTHISVICASFPFRFYQEEWFSTPPYGRGSVIFDDSTGLIYALDDLDVIDNISCKVVYTKFTGSRLYFTPKDGFISVTLKDGVIPRDERLQNLKDRWKELGCDVSDVERINCVHVPCKDGFSWINEWGIAEDSQKEFVIYTMMKLGLDNRNERRSRRFEATAKTIKPTKTKPSESYRWMTLRDYKTGLTLDYVDLDDYGSVEVEEGSTPRGKRALLLKDYNTGKIVAYVDIDGMPTVEYDFS